MKYICPACAILLVLLVGWVHGHLSDRWGVPENVEHAASLLQKIPQNFGDWSGKDGPVLSERAEVVAGAIGYVSRYYVNRSTGHAVAATILCGRPGPISTHSPAVCFTSAGTEQVAEEVVHELKMPDGTRAQFFQATFRPPITSPGPDVETFWACSVDGKKWEAVTDGRLVYAGEPHLYRTFVTTLETTVQKTDGAQILDSFLKDFLPQVAKVLREQSE